MKTDIICEMEKMTEQDKLKLIDLAGAYKILKSCGVEKPRGTVLRIKAILDKYDVKYVDDILD